jgi:Leucine-rich repeat (LRR) protein
MTILYKIPSDIFIYEIISYADQSLYSNLLRTNKEINHYCSKGQVHFIIKIKPTIKEIKKWSKRKNVYVELDIKFILYDVITDSHLRQLVNLKILHLGSNNSITDHCLKYLKNLKVLDISWSRTITNRGLRDLHNLEVLDISKNNIITFKGLEHLNLKKLYMYCNTNFNRTDIKKLHKNGTKTIKKYLCD